MRQPIRFHVQVGRVTRPFGFAAWTMGRCGLVCALFLLIVAAVVGDVCECRAQQQPETPVVKIEGDVTIWRNGDPVTSGKVLVVLDEAISPQPYWVLDINSTTGHFEGNFQSGLHYIVKPVFSIPDQSDHNALIRSIPLQYRDVLGPWDTTCDFAIKPGIFVEVNSSGSMPSIGGATVRVVGGYTYSPGFPTFVPGTRAIAIYPDDYRDPFNEPMPLSGSLYLTGLQPFTKAMPQDEGLPMLFDCSHSMIDFDTPHVYYQSIVPLADRSAVYSWDPPGGIGWSYFPKTPDNRLPNNPNVHVTAQFGSLGTVAHNAIRLNGVYSSQDLTYANNFTGVFDFPIPECGPLDLRIEYRLQLQSGIYQWFPLATHLLTCASNADLNGDTQFNLSDLPELAAAFGSCLGQPNYLVCADYRYDNCVNTTDVAVFSNMWWYNGKSAEGPGIANAFVRFQETDRGTVQVLVDAPEGWAACVARFELDGIEDGDVNWVASGAFLERSLLAPHNTAGGVTCDLFAFGPAAGGETVLGELVVAAKGGAPEPKLVSLGVVAPVSGADDGREYSQASLGDPLPNPFNPQTVIPFELALPEQVCITIYDLSGRAVRTLLDEDLRAAGRHEVAWDGRGQDGKIVPSGVYLCRMVTRTADLSRRMTLLR